MPDLPNPIGGLADGLGSALAGVAASAFDEAMKSLWDFAIALLTGVFAVVDHLTTPDLDPRTGPLASVLPAMLWIGGVLLALLCLLQIGKAALSGGGGLAHLATGIAQYVVISASGLGLLAVAVTAANAAAIGILTTGLHVTTWSGISASNSPWQNAVHGVSGAGLGLIALLGVLPAAITLLVTVLVREAAILVIAATVPILAAGLVAEATARWFWTALRWLLALVMLTPAVALVLALGLHVAAGASGATGAADPATSAGQSAVTAFVGAGILLVSVFCPMALFKLFAFVDPGTASGQRLRTSLSDARGANASPASGQTATAGGGTDASDQVENRWSHALTQLSTAHRTLGGAAQKVMSTAAPILAAAGVGDGVDHDAPNPRSGSRPQATTRNTKPPEPPTTAEPPTAQPPTPPDLTPPAPPTGDGPGPFAGGGSGGGPAAAAGPAGPAGATEGGAAAAGAAAL